MTSPDWDSFEDLDEDDPVDDDNEDDDNEDDDEPDLVYGFPR